MKDNDNEMRGIVTIRALDKSEERKCMKMKIPIMIDVPMKEL
jgi:hypothetical protein